MPLVEKDGTFRNNLELAVTEACANAVRHAYGDGTGGNVEVSLRPRANGVELQVADTGAGIELPLPDPPTAELPGGRPESHALCSPPQPDKGEQ